MKPYPNYPHYLIFISQIPIANPIPNSKSHFSQISNQQQLKESSLPIHMCSVNTESHKASFPPLLCLLAWASATKKQNKKNKKSKTKQKSICSFTHKTKSIPTCFYPPAANTPSPFSCAVTRHQSQQPRFHQVLLNHPVCQQLQSWQQPPSPAEHSSNVVSFSPGRAPPSPASPPIYCSTTTSTLLPRLTSRCFLLRGSVISHLQQYRHDFILLSNRSGKSIKVSQYNRDTKFQKVLFSVKSEYL